MDKPGGTSDPATAADEDFQRELRARRKDLEREFDSKMRDLKAQEKRRMDRLEADRLEFEQHKREKGKELADREHRVKAREGREKAAAHRPAEDRKELDALRAQMAELRERRDALAHRQADLDARNVKALAKAKANTWRLVALAAISIAGSLTWLVIALKQGGGSRTLLPLAMLVATAVALAWPARRPT